MTGRFVIPQDSAVLLLVSCPNSKDSDLVRRYGAAHEVDMGLAVRCTGLFLVSPLMSVDRETAATHGQHLHRLRRGFERRRRRSSQNSNMPKSCSVRLARCPLRPENAQIAARQRNDAKGQTRK